MSASLLNKLTKNSELLCVPLMVAAYASDCFSKHYSDPLFKFIEKIDYPILYLFWFCLVVGVAYLVFIKSSNFIINSHNKAVRVNKVPYFLNFVAISFLSVGVFSLSLLYVQAPKIPINLFWSLGCLSYGISLKK